MHAPIRSPIVPSDSPIGESPQRRGDEAR
jgi:hypothetical protein